MYGYPFIISMNRCDGSCNTVEDPFVTICVPNKTEDVNLIECNMIKGINESKTPAKLIYVSVDVYLIVGNVNGEKYETMISVDVSVKKQKNIALVKKIMPRILLYGLANVMMILNFVDA